MNTKDSTPNPMDRADLPEEVRGFDPRDYLAWRHHPMSRAVFRYLTDFREALIRDHQQRWLSNADLPGNGESEARFRAQVIEEVITLQPGDITVFYVGRIENRKD